MIVDLLKKLEKLNIKFELNGENLDILAPKGILNEELIDTIRTHKTEIIEFINEYKLKKEFYYKIPQISEQSNYILSSSQRRLWVLSQFEDSNIAYNMPGVYVFDGELNFEALEKSFLSLIERHESLRTSFKQDEYGQVKQFITPINHTTFNIHYLDIQEQQDTHINQLIQNDFITPFNLEHAPLLRATIYKLNNSKHIFTYVMHHIISDGWSMGILIKELITFYNSYLKGEVPALKPLHIQYKDYAAWQQHQLSEDFIQEHKNYWLKQFEGELPVLEMPTDKKRPAIKTSNGQSVSKKINHECVEKIKALCQKNGSTLFMGLLASVNTLLYRYTNQEDIIIGSPIAGREHAELEDQIGFYINTLALRSQFSGNNTFEELLQHIKQITLDAYKHQIFPFDELVDELNLQRNMSRNALFDVMVVLQNNNDEGNMFNHNNGINDLNISHYKEAKFESNIKFDLTFTFIENQNSIEFTIEYNSDLFLKESMESLVDHFTNLLIAIVENPKSPINKLDYLSSKEKHQLFIDFNNTKKEYSKDLTIVKLFEDQVEKTPHNIALIGEGKEITYHELNNRCNKLAYTLKQNGAAKDSVIGLMADRNIEMVVGMMGILKSGSAYLPLDSTYPKERLKYMIEDSGCKLLVLDENLKNTLENKPVFFDFSLFYFSSYNNDQENNKYKLLTDSAKWADKNGFKAIWTPERHFHEFGGLFPNPSLISAALAMITEKVEIRSGSIVSPLHHTIRIAEEWAVVDNLSNGRVGLSFASGWQPNDFVISPKNFNDRHKIMYEQIETIKKLWKGESITQINGLDKNIEVKIFPSPIQKKLPIWITAAGNKETFINAGKIGANILTHLLGQDIETLRENIRAYRDARTEYDFNQESGKITIMLHTFIGEDLSQVKEIAKEPFKEYLKSSVGLANILSDENIDEKTANKEIIDKALEAAFIRYFKTSSLIGTKESCKKLLDQLKDVGIDEIACLIDFGIDHEIVMNNLQYLNELKNAYSFSNIKREQIKKINLQEINTESIPTQNITCTPKPNDLAYVIYTSGSTGQPKGVMIEHKSVVNFFSSMKKDLAIDVNDKLLSVTSYSFDISILELLLPLTIGATTIISSRPDLSNLESISDLINKYKPTIIQGTPSFWQILIDSGWNNASKIKILCGGEKMPEILGKKLMEISSSLWNMYGPTETTIWSLIKEIKKENDISLIGQPIQNTEIYILDKEKNIIPKGVVGEIFIGGDGLARGYLNRDELTKEKFILHPFKKNERIYKTGDLGRWLQNGSVEFKGRKDNQIKLRGYRIEIGEIETHINNYPTVKNSIVTTKTNKGGDKELVAYIISNEKLNIKDLKIYLMDYLPIFMIPGYFIQLESIPLTINKKIDYAVLPSPDEINFDNSDNYIAPRNETEEKLVKIWEEILGKSNIGIADDFFELGGHSLKLLTLISRIKTTFLVQINLQNVFHDPTIESISEHIIFILNQNKLDSNKQEFIEIDL